MGLTSQRKRRADAEASDWFARLNATVVTTDDLTSFQTWRKAPDNDAAYTAIEKFWRDSGSLRMDLDIQAVIKADAERRTRRKHSKFQRNIGRGALVLSAVILSALLAVAAANYDRIRYGDIYNTAVDEQRLVRLPDGSRLRLDTNTRLAVRILSTERRIMLLKGQAYFEVARDPSRPFFVDAGRTEIRAVGTQFDVLRDDKIVRVTLVEGVVKVSPGDLVKTQVTLRSGQALAVRSGGTPLAYPSADVSSATSWTTGRLVFADRPLAEAVAEVNRYTRHPLILDDADLGKIHISGAFETGDTAGFVSAVCSLYGLEAEVRPDGAMVLRAREPRKSI